VAWSLDPKLDHDTAFVVDWPLCRVVLMNDSNYPWLILVPRLEDLRDFHDVPAERQPALSAEIGRASRALQSLFKAHKMNVAALGNVTPQLHIHVIARQSTDAAWPRPVWGVAPAAPYDPIQLGNTIAAIQAALNAA
jgi:diadenosine tetraphosphate (Ap4A) HIT family hydrolase